ncbi:hypothetical protein ACSYAF_05455 [Edwardsiella tarda]
MENNKNTSEKFSWVQPKNSIDPMQVINSAKRLRMYSRNQRPDKQEKK